MSSPRGLFVGGNWKMNGTLDSSKKLIDHLIASKLDESTEIVVAPPFIHLLQVKDYLQASSHPNIKVSAQNAYHKSSGAFTGEVSVDQLVDAQVPWVIIGHSERRTLFGEADHNVAEKTKAALEAGLSVILCIGETLEQREKDETVSVVTRQLNAVEQEVKDWSKIVVAYEPVWAIGTGKVATSQQAQEVHSEIRKWAASKLGQSVANKLRIIYGGSVAAKNCKELSTQADIDGFLVGGASLKPEFVDIVNARL
ncbi:putative TPI1-triose-phosphate isomerase [Tilletiaria anomala UBC 951]|uniref:Triosephosphate isomerase n=1 Tax=Tilletiaria anomala (strain ATCC 24038 / CBS 436.72 / UBC 951) TaxID=1037660 RepID=A0A066VUY0_TILAU|nr:putative TPI1-triose-phosphate isomerase [Tilletiaria anomala UBC 951]KDN45286.1 putative TPI1-triose-phosphate isomerase [Tilletiaria anomala UBC 951]